MSQRFRSPWLPRFLFRFTIGAATLLLGTVLLAPWLDPEPRVVSPGARLWGLFAHDPLVRQTTVASALAMYVTAGVFFRPGDKTRAASSRSTKPPPPPVRVVGA
jgi:hypothetical protein